MRKVKLTIVFYLIMMIALMLCACGSSGGAKSEKTPEPDGEVTEITRKDLNEFITGIGSEYIVVNTNTALINSQMSYDSDVILDIQTESEDVDTSLLGKYEVIHTVTVDTDAYCEKKNKKNLIKGDTLKIVVNSFIEVIDKETAKSMEEYGADVIGYND